VPPGLGAILGYLAAGMAIGPWGLKLVTEVEHILHFAEFGVVLMLFLVGLELEPRRLWTLRRPIFGWGSAQVLGCAGVLAGSRCLAGRGALALVAGAGAGAVEHRHCAAGDGQAATCCPPAAVRPRFPFCCFRTWRPYPSWRCCRFWAQF
jgi:hypothetical protein